MKRIKQGLGLLLAVLLVLTLIGCSKNGENASKKSTLNPLELSNLKIGVLFTDKATASGQAVYHKQGILDAMQALQIPEEQVVFKYNITDVSFDSKKKLSNTTLTTKVKETEVQTTEQEPESFTDNEGRVIIQAVPIPEPIPETGISALQSLLSDGCNLIIATDPTYDALLSWAAPQYKKVAFVQYKGTHQDIPNLQSYDDKAYEAFYMAGAVAALSGSKNPGFIAALKNTASAELINAFTLGAKRFNSDIQVTARFTRVPFDLSLERTMPLTLLETDKCDFIVQSVLTALPQTVASNIDKAYKTKPVHCIGYGYDMVADGGKYNLCSVEYHYNVYFESIIQSLISGTFTAEPYVGGVKEGMVTLSKLHTNNEKITQAVSEITEEFKTDSLNVFDTLDSVNHFDKNVIVK